jgi:flagellar basal-body rod protein FlgF
MQADQARMESISHNTANVLTPGFKRHIAITPGFATQFAQGAAPGTASPAAPASAPMTMIDPSSGTLRYTGNVHDVAIEGAAFFEIITPTGIAYTKAGSLRTDVQGRLVTLQHAPVMGAAGELRLSGGAFSIAPNGDVSQDGRIAGRLRLVQFVNPEALIPAGNGIYEAGASSVQEPKTTSSLRIGFLESSNVSTPQEMVRLTETVRHFESLQRIVQGYDETLEKTIRKLGDF